MCKRRMEDFKRGRHQKKTTQEERAEPLKGANRLPVLHPMMVKPCFQSPSLSHFPCPCPDRCMEPRCEVSLDRRRSAFRHCDPCYCCRRTPEHGIAMWSREGIQSRVYRVTRRLHKRCDWLFRRRGSSLPKFRTPWRPGDSTLMG